MKPGIWMRGGLVGVAALVAAALLAAGTGGPGRAPGSGQSGEWRFAVSGDSRNCGDVVMPTIAQSVRSRQAAFYWHLGDFRKIYDFDEDIQHEPAHLQKPLTIYSYLAIAWPDFIENQLLPFGNVPVFLGVGNHDTLHPKTRPELLVQFADWFNAPAIRRQRLADDSHDFALKTYYHWIERGVDFITLDNATDDQFDPGQMRWLEAVVARDEQDAAVHTIVVGMHKPFPDSISGGHSMSESPTGIASGRRAVELLLRARDQFHKRVYALASHDHFYLANDLDTPYWRSHGGVLPSWIVGTAGAVRYPLPKDRSAENHAQTNVYGYLLGSVRPGGEIEFRFVPITEGDVPAAVTQRFTAKFVNWCFDENSVAH
jgi:hypothetical protein